MLNEITLDNSTEAHALAKEIARRGRLSVAIIRQDNSYIVRVKPGIDISSYKDLLSKKKVLQNPFSATPQENKKISNELQIIKDKLNHLADHHQNQHNLILDQVNSLFHSGEIKICTSCHGLGRSNIKCSECNGDGVTKVEKMNFNLCRACGGDGGISGNCYSCGGTGYKEDISYSPCQICDGIGLYRCDECGQAGFMGDPQLIQFCKKICEIIGLDMKNPNNTKKLTP